MICCVHLQIAEPINACSFAAGLASRESGVGSAFAAFRGQMGCLYLFDDVLNPGRSTVTFEHALLYLQCYFSSVATIRVLHIPIFFNFVRIA